ncbi:MAG TPA: sigma-70 family RNA polymerase sigma factor [Planctomycetes bacterium]|nr:sigma-70 family RNA polymerase sigma factor [Planctomycetota bacterium]
MLLPTLLSSDALDALLEECAIRPDEFTERARELAERLDREGVDLELPDPLSYRRDPESRARSAGQDPFRSEVDAILPLERDEEQRLARRIEFARIRLEKALAEEGLDEGMDVLSHDIDASEGLPERVARRARELHALRTEMVERNLYLVLINVERYAQTGNARMDLIQEGCVSLFRAVDGFDWRRGLLFRTYAVHWLNQAFRNYIYNNGHTVRVPVYLQKALKHIHQAAIQTGKAKPTPEEIAACSDLKPALVESALKASRSSYSIDADFRTAEGSRLRDLLEDESAIVGYDPRFEDLSLETGLARALSTLNDREALVLRMRFGIGFEREHTLAEVAAELGVSVERVRQIQVRAIAKLDTPSLRREMDPFLN